MDQSQAFLYTKRVFMVKLYEDQNQEKQQTIGTKMQFTLFVIIFFMKASFFFTYINALIHVRLFIISSSEVVNMLNE